MKTQLSILLSAAAFSATVICCGSDDSKSSATSELSQQYKQELKVVADSMKTDSIKLDPKCIQFSGQYPIIKGINDSRFSEIVNSDLKAFYYKTITHWKSECDSMEAQKQPEDEGDSTSFPYCIYTINASYYTYSLQPITSIGQFFYYEPCMGNGTGTDLRILNTDLANNKILKPTDLLKNGPSVPQINQVVKKYFDTMFKKHAAYLVDEPIHYPIVRASGLDSLNFALRHDSIVFIIQAQPLMHDTHGVYEIPLAKYAR